MEKSGYLLIVAAFALVCAAGVVHAATRESFPLTGNVVADSTPWWMRNAQPRPMMGAMTNGTNGTNGTVRKPMAPPGYAWGRMMNNGSKNITVNSSCIIDALSKRDDAVSAAVDAHASAVKAAISARKTALAAAWGLTGDARKTALHAAWQQFKTANRDAQKQLRAARETAWKQWATDARACKIPMVDTTTLAIEETTT